MLAYHAPGNVVPPSKTACLDAMVAYTQQTTCRRESLLEYFGEKLPPRGGGAGAGGGAAAAAAPPAPPAPPADAFPCCDNCENVVQRVDLTDAFRALAQAIAFCGGRTGAGKPIDLVLGKVDASARGPSPKGLPFFGKGSGKTLAYWKAVLQLAKNAGLVT